MTVSEEVLRDGLRQTLERTELFLGTKHEGKVRDSYTLGNRRCLVTTDRISAFDRVLGTLPYKGQVLNRLAAWWFEKTKEMVSNHVIEMPDPNVLLAHQCTPLPVEMVVRAYITGVTSTSMWTHYERGERVFCGHRLPEGLRRHQKLETALLTPSTKAEDGEHDVSASREEILAMGRIQEADFDEAARMAMTLFDYGQRVCAERGLILVDTKYEFGKTSDGRIVVIDEMHTPDSSRFWFAESYRAKFDAGQNPDSFDKEYVRRWLKEQGYTGDGPVPSIPDEVRVEASRRYIQACEMICGEDFVPDVRPPHERMQDNLRGSEFVDA